MDLVMKTRVWLWLSLFYCCWRRGLAPAAGRPRQQAEPRQLNIRAETVRQSLAEPPSNWSASWRPIAPVVVSPG